MVALLCFAIAGAQPPVYVVLYFAAPHVYFQLTHQQPLAFLSGWLGLILLVFGACLLPTSISHRIGYGLTCLFVYFCWSSMWYVILSFFFAATFI